MIYGGNMESEEIPKMSPFDQAFATEQMQLIKLLIPYMPPGQQRFLGVYVKFMEFQNTLHHFHAVKSPMSSQNLSFHQDSLFQILSEISIYFPSRIREQVEQISSLLSMMEMVQQMQENQDSFMGDLDPMDMMQQMFVKPETTKEGGQQNDGVDQRSGSESSGSTETGTF